MVGMVFGLFRLSSVIERELNLALEKLTVRSFPRPFVRKVKNKAFKYVLKNVFI